MTVSQSLTNVTVTPATATVATNGTQQFTATAAGPVRQCDRLSGVYVGGEWGRDDLFVGVIRGRERYGWAIHGNGFLGGPNGYSERDNLGYAAASNRDIDMAKHGFAGNPVDQ